MRERHIKMLKTGGAPVSDTVATIEAEATRWMARGMRLAAERTPAALGDAIACFDRAAQLRARLLTESTPEYRYGIAAAWLNRAEGLTSLGGLPDLEAALRAYDAAIALLAELPLDADVR